jgi:hypothetical protein
LYIKLRQLIKLNAVLKLEHELLKDGNYQNVTSGALFYDGSDMSRLVSDTSPAVLAEIGGLAPGQVWRSAFKNWVYESGVNQLNQSPILATFPLPLRASGVYVDGRFCPTDPAATGYDPTCSHTIDYLNGRVVFDSPLGLDSNVHSDFSYKEVKVAVASRFNDQFLNGVLETKYLTNPRTSNQLTYPSGSTRIQPYPIVFIEDAGRTWEAYQIGDRSLVAQDEIIYHIYALDDASRDNIIDLISFEDRKPVLMVDFNYAPFPLSGLLNTLSPNYIPYVQLLQNPVVDDLGNHAISFRGYVDDSEIVDLDSFRQEPQSEVFERAQVRANFKIYTINAISPINFNPLPA